MPRSTGYRPGGTLMKRLSLSAKVQEGGEKSPIRARRPMPARGEPGQVAEQLFQSMIPADTDKDTTNRQLNILRSALLQQQATLAAIDSDSAQKRAERKQIESEIAKLRGTIPLIRKRS